MDYKDAQRLLASAGYYKGPIDGFITIGLSERIDDMLERHAALVVDSVLLSKPRRIFAAAQLVLHFAGFQVGPIDGYPGNETVGALLEWENEKIYGKPLELPRVPVNGMFTSAAATMRFPRQAEIVAFYGVPGVGNSAEGQLVRVPIPYRVIIEYAPSQERKTLNLHKKCADSYSNILDDVHKRYGDKKIKELGLDQFAGDYVPRLMRGSTTTWSMHAYGCAIDWDSDRNGLTVRSPKAQFSKPEYSDFIDIHESHGWVSLGRAIGRDYMHFQAARL